MTAVVVVVGLFVAPYTHFQWSRNGKSLLWAPEILILTLMFYYPKTNSSRVTALL
jgi:hypothetical protein